MPQSSRPRPIETGSTDVGGDRVRWWRRGSADEPIRLRFLCVENAARSQMAAAFAEREAERRDLADAVDVGSAGTHPADAVDEGVVEAMAEVDLDLSDRTPSLVDLSALESVDFLVTMGCYISEFDPSSFGVDSREWDLTDPAGEDLDVVRTARDAVEERVVDLFDEIEEAVG